MYDFPNDRSLHTEAKIRGGGAAILISFIIFTSILYFLEYIPSKLFLSQVIGSITLGVIGWIDDKKGLSAKFRFSIHIILAVIALILCNGFSSINNIKIIVNLSFIGNIIMIFYIVWMINLYNFMDGIDGLAISQALIPSIFLAMYFGLHGEIEVSLLSMVLIFSSVFFYNYNWPPSKMFMGDVLSGFLGYYFAIMTFYLYNELHYSFFLIPVLMTVFIYDSTATLIKRVIRKEKIWEAHNEHYYQKFAKIYGHKKVTVCIICLDILLYLPAYLLIKFPKYDILLTIIAYSFISIFIWIAGKKI